MPKSAAVRFGNTILSSMTSSSASPKLDRPTVFISYSHKDKRWLDELLTMLDPLVRTGALRVWWDGNIEASQLWRERIESELGSAGLAVLLVSRHFLASDFIAEVELPYFLEAALLRKVKILWMLVSPCLYEKTPLRDIQALHDLARPLNSLHGAARDSTLKAICESIETQGATAATALSLDFSLDLDIGRLPTSVPLFVGRDSVC
jgi:TIR domain